MQSAPRRPVDRREVVAKYKLFIKESVRNLCAETSSEKAMARTVLGGGEGVNVLLAARFITVSANDQLDTNSFLTFVYSSSVHVSSNQVLIIKRVSCINTTPGICHCM